MKNASHFLFLPEISLLLYISLAPQWNYSSTLLPPPPLVSIQRNVFKYIRKYITSHCCLGSVLHLLQLYVYVPFQTDQDTCV